MGEWSRLELPMTGGCYCGAIQHDEQEREGYLYVTVGSLDRPAFPRRITGTRMRGSRGIGLRANPDGMGAATTTRVRDGNRTVLLVVDMQVGVLNEAWDAPRMDLERSRLVERAREQGAPVIWVQHSDQELVYGSPEWMFVDELTPLQNEPVIHKRFNSSFEETSLEEELERFGATHIVLAEAATNWCIRATAYGALEPDTI